MIPTSAGLSDQGSRATNQDRILFDDTLGLYLVCDGLGGRRAGNVAAELAVNSIRQYIESSRDPKEVTWPYGYDLAMSFGANRLTTAAKLANRQVWRKSEESLEFLGMGTTICAVLLEGSAVVVANIGDSRVYLLREGRLEQLTVDDTAAGTRAASVPTAAQSALPGIRNVLTQAAGSRESAEVHLRECALQSLDRLLLCSDGLHGCVPDDQIKIALENASSPAAGARVLVDAAHAAGAPDNASVIIVQF
jgi:protein phosphatase